MSGQDDTAQEGLTESVFNKNSENIGPGNLILIPLRNMEHDEEVKEKDENEAQENKEKVNVGEAHGEPIEGAQEHSGQIDQISYGVNFSK